MKKEAFLLLIVTPYLYITVMLLLFLLSRSVPALDKDEVIFGIMGLFCVLSAALCAVYPVTVLSGPMDSPWKSAKHNLQLKLSYLPAYLLSLGILCASIISAAQAEGASEGGLGVFLWFLLLLPVFLHGLLLLWSCAVVSTGILLRIYRDKTGAVLLYAVPHWLPVLDLFVAAALPRKLRP